MGKSANPLISVQYTDETNYVEASSTDDVMGMVMDANWGPCGTPVVCNSTTFRSIFNPQGLGRLNGTLATALRAFEKNQSYIEVVRLGSKENWLFVYITSAGTVGTYSYPYSTDSSAIDFSAVATAIETSFEGDPKPTVQALFRLRYPGGFPAQITLSASPKTFLGTQMYSLELAAYSGQTYTTAGASTRGKSTKASGATAQPSFTNILETLTFSLVDLTYNGVSYNYADVITNDSTYFVSDVAWAAGKSVSVALTNAPFVYKVADAEIPGIISPSSTVPAYVADDFVAAYELFKDRDISSSTELVNSYLWDAYLEGNSDPVFDSSAGPGAVMTKMSEIAELRQDCCALLGFPTTVNSSAWINPNEVNWETTTRTNARTWFDAIANAGLNMHSFGIVGWERYTLRTTMGVKVYNLDCTAGWCGRISAVAASTRNRNQLPSYKAYGTYLSTLVRTMSFENVVEMHKEDGIGSVYSTATGNFIFDVKGLYGVGTSYFAQANVMRVIEFLLSNSYDIIEQVIHTDVAANKASRIDLEGRMNTMLSWFISRNELTAESYVDIGDSLNSDDLTNGGEYLNINIVCYFLKLTQGVNINIIARDGSVSSSVSMVN